MSLVQKMFPSLVGSIFLCICRKTNWSQLRKHVYDNMSAYLARKEERIQTREAQKAAREELKQKPPKIPKLEVQDCSHEPTKEDL